MSKRHALKVTIGKIILPSNVFVGKHEKKTVDFLATELSYDIAFLVPDRQKGRKTPDIKMNNIPWEIKSPKGKSSRTIENNLRLALRQSPNIVLDLRRMDGRVPTEKHLAEIGRQFQLAKSMRHVIAITRQGVSINFMR